MGPVSTEISVYEPSRYYFYFIKYVFGLQHGYLNYQGTRDQISYTFVHIDEMIGSGRNKFLKQRNKIQPFPT